MMKIIPRQRTSHYKGELKSILINLFIRNTKKDTYVKKFEREFAKYIGTRYAISMQSGRACLYLILKALNIKKDDEIILASYNTPIVPGAIIQYGAKPIFVDVDKNTFTIDPNKIKSSITKKTKAVIVTHIEGQLCEMDEIIRISNKYKLHVIEDCAHAIGSKYKEKKAGTFGIASFYSFCSGKQINSLGGGVIVTKNKSIHDSIRRISKKFSYPTKSTLIKKILKFYIFSFALHPAVFLLLVYPILLLSYILKRDIINDLFEDLGTKKIDLNNLVNFSNLQSSLADLGLKNIDNKNKKRIENAILLDKLLKKSIKRQEQTLKSNGVFLNFTILVKNRNEVMKKLLMYGIDTQISWMLSCSNLKRLEKYNKNCLISEEISKKALYIPIYPGLYKKDVVYISECLNKII